MANTDRPTGCRVVGTINGGPYTGPQRVVYSPSEDLFMGDIVEVTTTGVAIRDGAYPTVGRADASDSDYVWGVVDSWAPDPANLGRTYHAASSTIPAYVIVAPDVVMEIQSDDGTPTFASVGLNFNIVVAAGNTTTGVSGMELDGSSGATTNTLPLKLIGMVDRPDNDPTAANMKCLVMFNAHAMSGGTGSTGI